MLLFYGERDFYYLCRKIKAYLLSHKTCASQEHFSRTHSQKDGYS